TSPAGEGAAGNGRPGADGVIDAIGADCAMRFRGRHGTVRILGMSQPLDLNRVFTGLTVDSSDYLTTPVDAAELDRQRKQGGATGGEATGSRDAIDVASAEQFLIIYGPPGSGKSTLLRSLGIRAAQALSERTDQTAGRPASLPVLVELRRLAESAPRLE